MLMTLTNCSRNLNKTKGSLKRRKLSVLLLLGMTLEMEQGEVGRRIKQDFKEEVTLFLQKNLLAENVQCVGS